MWRKFRKWAGFPIWEDVPVCRHGYKMNLGEWPVYDWVCDHNPKRKVTV